MTLTVPQFRTRFSEFGTPAVYSDDFLQMWLDVGYKLVDADSWGDDMVDLGASLCAAHFIVLQKRDQLTAAKGGVPGFTVGVVSSKSIDSVSVAYDVASAMVQGAGQWNATRYGQQYAQLSRLYGAGAMQF